MSTTRRLLALLAISVTALVATDSVGFHPIVDGGRALSWGPSSLPVSYVVQEDGSDDLTYAATKAAIDLAFQQWESVTTSTIAFTEDTAADASRTDWASSNIHLILFDEDNSTGMFPGVSATIALTPTTFDLATGEIIDSDIIFNGEDFVFSTDGSGGTQDLQSIATHEIGHLIGLDHCAIGAATMYPFTAAGTTTHRTLSQDDALGATDLYPGLLTFGSISGNLEHSTDSSAIVGAHLVAVNDDGVIMGSTYSDTNGDWILDHLPPDTYTIYAEPLDLPVLGVNLSSDVGASTQTDFATEFYGGNSSPTNLNVSSGVDTAIGTFTLSPVGAFNLTDSDSVPALLPRGGFASIVIYGDGLDGVDETITVSGSNITIFWSNFSAGVSPHYTLILQSLSGIPLGPRYLEVRDSADDIAMLSGFVEVVEALPTLTGVAPSVGTKLGGNSVTLTGTNFQSGATAFFGGVPATTTTVDSSTQITCVPAAADSATVGVVVQNPDGRIANLSTAYTFEGDPTIASIFPTGGTTTGGTTVTIEGSGFEALATVTFGGLTATITSITETEIMVTTPVGTVGPANVRVLNPGGLFVDAPGAFTYMTTTDPTLSSFTPSNGPSKGGTQVEITGTGFDSGAMVTFDGAAAAKITVVSSTQILATTPAGTPGDATVRVMNPSGSGIAAGAAFTYMAPSGGGGGGGCGALPPMYFDGNDPWQGLGLMLPYLVLIGWLFCGGVRLRLKNSQSLGTFLTPRLSQRALR